MKRFPKGMFLTQKQFVSSQAGLRCLFQFVRKMLPRQISKLLVGKVISYFAVRATRAGHGLASDTDFESLLRRNLAARTTT
jgi:hypothetical protein